MGAVVVVVATPDEAVGIAVDVNFVVTGDIGSGFLSINDELGFTDEDLDDVGLEVEDKSDEREEGEGGFVIICVQS